MTATPTGQPDDALVAQQAEAGLLGAAAGFLLKTGTLSSV